MCNNLPNYYILVLHDRRSHWSRQISTLPKSYSLNTNLNLKFLLWFSFSGSSHKFQPGLILNKQASGLDYCKKSELIMFAMILDLYGNEHSKTKNVSTITKYLLFHQDRCNGKMKRKGQTICHIKKLLSITTTKTTN